MKGVVFLLAFATTALAQLPEETPTPPIDPKIDFKVSVAGKRNEFHLGEIIPIKLFFSSRTKKRYELNEAQYDRSGRMNYENFVVTPADGAEDPLAEYFRPDSVHVGGGLTGFSFLEPRPWAIQLNLNEWIRFTKPGEYKLKISSSRVKKIDSSGPYGKTPVTAISNEITLKILPRDPDWEKRVCDEAVATLKSLSALQKDVSEDSPAHHAWETLRFLGTAEAARALANQLGGEHGCQSTCYFGLVYSPERAVAREALEQALAEPDRPIDLTFLDTLIDIEQGDTKDEAAARKDEQKVLQDVARVLPEKRGDALLVSLYSLLDHFWIRGGKDLLPKDTVDQLVKQLIPFFERLTWEQQSSLLSDRWENIKTPALLPLLKRYSQQDFSDVSPSEYAYAIEIPGVALRRWFELDPAGARPAIIKEISQPKPRFEVRELGMLPDQTLPEVEQLLIDHLRGNRDFQSASKLARLIARYATRAILPQVLRELDANIGKWTCEIQNPLLGYVLRFDPKSARPRIEKAIAVQRKNSTTCNVLCGIALIHYDPLLEELAIRALDDSRGDNGDAIGLLSGFGSAAAEEVLWRHYEKWCQRWAGREGQVNSQAVDRDATKPTDLGLGRAFVMEIVEGKGWLTDESKLRRLAAMSKVPTIQFQLELYLERWQPLPLRVSVDSCAPTFSPWIAQIAQYQIKSIKELKERLSQFPRETKFVLSLPRDEADQSCVEDLRAFLASHHFSATESKPD
jgi:hypothetical protein